MIIVNSKELVAMWVATRVRDMSGPPMKDYEAIGFTRANCLIGGVVYTEYRKLSDGTYDIKLIAAGDIGWLTLKNLRQIFAYPFFELRCSRVSATAAKTNGRSRDLLQRLGFKLEGTIRGGVAVGRDAVMYGMQIDNCLWIKP